MDYPAVLAMPLRAFWAFNRNIDRLRAEADQRQLRLLACSQSGASAKSLSETLTAELGTPVRIEKPFDAAKFEELARTFSGQKPKPKVE